LGKTAPEPRHVAGGFVDHLNSVLNRTVSKSRLQAVKDETSDRPRFDLTRLVGGATQPLELKGTRALLDVLQVFDVLGEHCVTVTYSYRLQLGPEKESWVLRWDYYRERPKPDYPYPLAHVHFNAELAVHPDSHKLHVPTRRLPFELVLWHLIAEWDVRPLSEEWESILTESIHGFEERQTQL
jgi:hypothetical protein